MSTSTAAARRQIETMLNNRRKVEELFPKWYGYFGMYNTCKVSTRFGHNDITVCYPNEMGRSTILGLVYKTLDSLPENIKYVVLNDPAFFIHLDYRVNTYHVEFYNVNRPSKYLVYSSHSEEQMRVQTGLQLLFKDLSYPVIA